MKYEKKELLDQLFRHEGLVTTRYVDSVGVATIGIGRNLDHRGIQPFELEMIGFSPDTEMSSIKEITVEDAEWLCQNDIFRCEKEMLIFYPPIAELSKNRQLVLIDMLFNLGMTRLSKFVKFFRALEKEDYQLAACEMLDSLWAKQVKTRAETLHGMMLSG